MFDPGFSHGLEGFRDVGRRLFDSVALTNHSRIVQRKDGEAAVILGNQGGFEVAK